MKRLLPALSAIALAIPLIANATVNFTFNPTGAGFGAGAISIAGFDPAPGNALSLGGNPAPGGLSVGDVNKLLFQANLKTDLASDPLGINLTVVAGFWEKVESVTTTATTTGVKFSLDATKSLPADNYFYIYKSNGNNLAGTGFVSPGNLILSGHITKVDPTSGFDLSLVDAPVPLDGFQGDNWVGTKTLIGGGNTNISITVDSVNSGYFPDLLAGSMGTFGFVNTSLIDPFKQADPSRNFSDGGIVDANRPANIAPINGFNGTAATDFDFIFQADANLSFEKAVPEPGSVALVGLALAGLGFASRRRAK